MKTTKFDDPLKDDFRNFMYVVWKFLGLPEPTPIQYEMGDWLQTLGKRGGVMAGRGEAKSTITQAFCAWRLHRNPQERIMVISASKDRADDFSKFVRNLIRDMPMLRYLEPRNGQADSLMKFDVGPAKNTGAPSVKSIGVYGQMTGSRASLIICDDVEVANNSATVDQREKLLRTVLETEAIMKRGDEGQIIYLGTPQSEDTIYKKLVERGYAFRIWPARIPEVERIHIYGGNLAPTVFERAHDGDSGLATDPAMFDDQDLAERELSIGRSIFTLQYMLDTSLSDADKYPLRLSDLILMSLDREKAPTRVIYGSSKKQAIQAIHNVGFTGDRWLNPISFEDTWVPYEGIILAIDPAGKGKDEMGYCVAACLNSTIFVLSYGGLRGGYTTENLIFLAKIAQQFKVHEVIIEKNFGDGMFTELFKPILLKFHRVRIEDVSHSLQKEKRIVHTLEPIMNQHRLIFDENIVRRDMENLVKELDQGSESALKYNLFYQLTRVTTERGALKHDDRLDVLAMAVKYWVDYLGRDQDEIQRKLEDEMAQNEIDSFLNMSIHMGRGQSESMTPIWN